MHRYPFSKDEIRYEFKLELFTEPFLGRVELCGSVQQLPRLQTAAKAETDRSSCTVVGCQDIEATYNFFNRDSILTVCLKVSTVIEKYL